MIHAIMAITMLGAATHNGVLSIGMLRGKPGNQKLQHIYATVVFVTYVINYLIGLVMYPTFRVSVRAAYLDANVPMATGFFEVKEHWLALGLALLFWYYPYSWYARKLPPDKVPLLYPTVGIVLALLIWAAALTGLFLVALRSI